MGVVAESPTLEKSSPARSMESGVQSAAPAPSAFDPFVQSVFGAAPANPPAAVTDSLSIQRFRAPVLQRAQRLYGNRASQQIVQRAHAVQRQCACGGTCATCREQEGQRQATGVIGKDLESTVQRSSAAPAPAAFEGIPASTGEQLDPATRSPMEAHFGTDLDDVRVHTGSEAARSATSLDALAYTTGRDIYFAAGMYAPSNDSGSRLLAHEVAHVVQQGAGKEPSIATKSSHGARIGAPDDPLESEADQAAEAFMAAPLTDEDQRKKRESLSGMPSSPVQRSIQRQVPAATAPAASTPAPSAIGSMQNQPAPGSANPIGSPGLAPQKAPDAGTQTIKFENVLLSTDPVFVRYQLETMASWTVNGMSEVGSFLLRLTLSQLFDEPLLTLNDQVKANAAKAGPAAPTLVNPDTSPANFVVPKWLEDETRHRVANKDRARLIIAIANREYKVLSAEATEFLADFESVAHDKMFEALRDSQTRVEGEARRYGISLGEMYHRGGELSTTIAPAPRSPVDVMREDHVKAADAEQWRAAEGSRQELIQAAVEIKQQAAILQKRKEWVDGIEAQWRSARDPAGPYAFPKPRTPLDESNEFRFKDQLEKAQQQYQEYKRAFDEFVQKKQSKFPILAAFSHDGGDLNKLIASKGNDTARKAAILGQVNEKLKNIYDTRENMEAGKITPWSIPFVVEGTRQKMKIDKGTFLNRVLEDRYEEKKKEKADEEAVWKAISILSLALGLLALIPTPLSPFLAIASSGLGAAATVHDLQDYMIQSAASGTDFDKARAISQEDPSLFWLAIEIVGTVLDLGAAAKSLRAISGLKRAVIAGEEGAVKLLEAEASKIGPKAAQRLLQEAEAARQAAVAESRTAGTAAQVIEEEAIQAGKLAEATAERGGHLYQVLKDGSIVRCSKWCAKLDLLFGDLFGKHPHLKAELEALQKLKGKQAAEAAAILGERMQIVRQAEQMTLEELEKVIDEAANAKGTAVGDDLRYIRYQKQGGLLEFEEWFNRSRGGRLGGKAHQEIVEGILKKYPNSVTEEAQGGRFADAYTPAQPGKKAIYHQVGGTNLRGDPIARERRAIDDLRATVEGKNADIIFYPKNGSAPLLNPDRDVRFMSTWSIE